jgi:hypothetical protein
VPQCVSGLGDLPLAVVGHEADLGVLGAAVVGRADLPRRFTGQTFLCLSLASCDSGTYGDRHHCSVDLASLTNLASLSHFAMLKVALTSPSSTGHIGCVDHTLDVVLPVGGGVGAVLVDEDGLLQLLELCPELNIVEGLGLLKPLLKLEVLDSLLQLLELCPELEGFVGGGDIVGGHGLLEPQLELEVPDGLLQLLELSPVLDLGLLDLGLLEPQLELEVLDVLEKCATEQLQLVLPQILVLDGAVLDVGKSQFVGVGADRAAVIAGP